MDILRTKITNRLDDLKDRWYSTDKKTLHEAYTIKCGLYDDLTNFYTQDCGKMKTCLNKARVRDLYEVNKKMADRIYDVFSNGDYEALYDISGDILNDEFAVYYDWDTALGMIDE